MVFSISKWCYKYNKTIIEILKSGLLSGDWLLILIQISIRNYSYYIIYAKIPKKLRRNRFIN